MLQILGIYNFDIIEDNMSYNGVKSPKKAARQTLTFSLPFSLDQSRFQPRFVAKSRRNVRMILPLPSRNECMAFSSE